MIGPVIMVMKMKSRPIDIESFVCGLRPKDLVIIKTVWSSDPVRYLVIRVNKKQKSVDLLPLEDFYINSKKQEAPVLSVPIYMIKEAELLDKGDLLFLVNHRNPHIVNALEGM